MSDQDFAAIATRLVADLMPIAIVVGGEGSQDLAMALESTGAGADPLTPQTSGSYDLAILRADPSQFSAADSQAQLQALTALSDRIVFLPTASGSGLEALTPWLEHLAELGYQPVVEYDAGYLGDGAFLVDRNATAAETDLAGYTERVTMGGALHASTLRIAELEAALEAATARAADLQNQAATAAGAQAEAAALRDLLQQAEARGAALAEEAAAWTPLRAWINQAIADPGRDAAPASVRRGLFARLFRRAPATADELVQRKAARIRQSRLFDAAWYIACHPELAATGADPVLHYLHAGAAQGFDPGPWFDTAAYVRATPGLDPATTNPLLHAIATGREADLLARAH